MKHVIKQHPSPGTTGAHLLHLKGSDSSPCAPLPVLAAILQAAGQVSTRTWTGVWNQREGTQLGCSPSQNSNTEQVTLLPSRNNSADFRKITARINLALHNKNENFTAGEQLSVPYLFWVDIKHQGTNIQYGLLFLLLFLMPVTVKK